MASVSPVLQGMPIAGPDALINVTSVNNGMSPAVKLSELAVNQKFKMSALPL